MLLTTGAFSNFFDLLSRKLRVILKSETVLLAQVAEAEAMRLSRLPSLLYEVCEKQYDGVCLVQPVKYPDGKYYLKMGSNLSQDIFFHDLQEIQDWFKSGDATVNERQLATILHHILPSLKTERLTTRRCILTRTPSGRPYIGKVDDRGLFVATGGNGYAAMCSDALGRISASLLIHGHLPDPYVAESFTPEYADSNF